VADAKNEQSSFKEVNMKKATLFMAILILISFPVISANLQKEFTVSEGQKLDVNLKTGGSITITGWEKKILQVNVIFRNGDEKSFPIEMKQSGNVVSIESKFDPLENDKYRSPKLEIYLPFRFDMKLKTMGGEISLDHIQGDIEGKTMGGSLCLSHLKGHIDMVTMGGNISLKESDIDGSLKTMGGRVLLENVVGDIKGSSMGGNVVYNNVKTRKGESTGKVVKITTMGGSINVDEAFEGADVHTMGGRIHIKHAKKFVEAKTMGGDIRIDEIDGWVKATTMGGNIDVTMIGNPDKGKRDIQLTSMGGDITLEIPAGLSMNIDIQLSTTKGSWKNYKITSDFELDVQETKEWENSHGFQGAKIIGKGKTKDGRNLVKIKTINGNIVLKKIK
jgi:DUF4097 and DUF4098 domain-containing protein YvlB